MLKIITQQTILTLIVFFTIFITSVPFQYRGRLEADIEFNIAIIVSTSVFSNDDEIQVYYV